MRPGRLHVLFLSRTECVCALAPAPRAPQAIGEAELLSLLPKVDNLPSGFAPLLNVLLVDDSMTVRTLVAAIVRGLVWCAAFRCVVPVG